MKSSDKLNLALSNLWKRKLRTILTLFGVIIGIGALTAMISFGVGMQKNITDTFESFELFNYIVVFSRPMSFFEHRSEKDGYSTDSAALNFESIEKIKEITGVEAVLPDMRFPAKIEYEGNTEFTFIQVLPEDLPASQLMKLRTGSPFNSDEIYSLVLSDSLLRSFGIKDFAGAVGKKVMVTSFSFDFSKFNPFDLTSLSEEGSLPIGLNEYEFTVTGVTERMGFGGGAALLRSDVVIPSWAADKMRKIMITSLWDLFQTAGEKEGYSIANVRLSSPKYVDSVREKIREMGFNTFALIDQMNEIKTGFLFMDMILAAIGMIAIVVASLGIVNTMIMSIMERYSEIGIMKAVGAKDKDIKKIFFFESGAIGFSGGILGLGLGWGVAQIINSVINYILAKQGIPPIDYFNFPWWLCLGAVIFSVLVSLTAGTYPAMRAARVDPVVALRR